MALIVAIPYFYVGYWAFIIRRSLAVPIYRQQALGIGSVTIFFFVLLPAFQYFSSNFVRSLLIAPFFVATLYWVDASILAARRSDPLLRDTVHWSRIRFVFWAMILAGFILMVLSYIGLSTSNFIVSLVSDFLIFFYIVGPFLLGAAILPIVSRRSGDASLRRHLTWFGVFALLLLLSFLRFLVPGHTQFFLTWSGILAFAVALYPLYRSVKSLVPLNRLKLD